MARKTIPASPGRDRSRDDESLLLRSAESLGRMIGSLQRQLDVVTGRVNAAKPNGSGRQSRPDGNGRKTLAASGSSANAKSGTTRSRTGTRKTASARKTAKKR